MPRPVNPPPAQSRSADLPLAEAAALLNASPRVLLTTHTQPDADGIGSELALAECLEALGRRVTIANPDATPRPFAFLDPDRRIHVYDPLRPLPPVDLVVVLDTCAWGQLGALAEVVRSYAGRCLVIDHHVTREDLGGIILADAAAPCAALLVLEVMDELGWKPTARAAEALFAALVYDTGWLRYQNASPAAYAMAARLVQAGAASHRVFLALEERSPAPYVRLIGMALAGLELDCDGALAVMTVTAEMLAAAGVAAAEVTNLVNHCYSVEGVHTAAVFVEHPGPQVKVSLRSRGVVDVSDLALRYGGGGHARAAGARLDEPLRIAKARILADLRQAIAAHATGPAGPVPPAL